mmetsp:Transcript_11628/g.12964  ORF Transcript_11628/g.12964 Transcript_11628/m.12964 type:complete len:164 (+) Transcript_11628:194-685(+)
MMTSKFWRGSLKAALSNHHTDITFHTTRWKTKNKNDNQKKDEKKHSGFVLSTITSQGNAVLTLDTANGNMDLNILTYYDTTDNMSITFDKNNTLTTQATIMIDDFWDTWNQYLEKKINEHNKAEHDFYYTLQFKSRQILPRGIDKVVNLYQDLPYHIQKKPNN